MKRQTIKEVLAHEAGLQEAEYHLYIIREDETVFYIGQAGNTYNRLLYHLGWLGQSGATHVGQFILDQAPQSDTWLFEQYTVEECAPFVLAYQATFPEDIQAFYRAYPAKPNVNDAEEALIKLHRPCLNTAMNPQPPPLPEKYRKV